MYCATLAIALNIDGDTVPSEIQLLPAGAHIVGRDGRQWRNDRPEWVITNTQQNGMELPLDWEHATEHQALYGGPAPAAAWLDPQSLELRDGALWVQVAWTQKGRDAVASREYRYISPVFEYESESRRILRLLSAGLTNRPNLRLQALNHQQETVMEDRLRPALGLPQEATEEQVLSALNTLNTQLTDTQAQLQTALESPPDAAQYVPIAQYIQALTRATDAETALETARNQQATPDMTQYVPMAQYHQVLTRATDAETALNTQREAERETAINQAVDQAIEAGQIAPASREFYLAGCQQEGGLERFRTFTQTAPKVIADSGLDQQTTR